MDLRMLSYGDHVNVRGIADHDEEKMVILQSDKKAVLSESFRYLMADSAFDVVAADAWQEGVAKAIVNASAPKACDWHYFSIAYATITFTFCFGVSFCTVQS